MVELTLKHDKNSVVHAAEYLYKFSEEDEYRKNLEILVDHMTDMSNILTQYKNIVEEINNHFEKQTKVMKPLLMGYKKKHKKG